MAIDRNPNTESEKPATGTTSDVPATEGEDGSGSDSVKTFLQKLGDASTPAVTGQVIQVADNSGDLTGMLPVVEVPPNLFETEANVLPDHKTGPIDALPALPLVDFVQPHLSPDAIALNSDLVYQALTRKTNSNRFQISNPDLEAIKNILQNMEEVDRQQLEQVFEQKYGTSLRQAVKTYLKPGEAQVTVEAILNSKNGETNLAGNAQIALSVLETDPVRGMRLLRAVLGPLDASQLATMQEKFVQDYGIELKAAIEASNGLNADQKAVLVGILPGMATLEPAVLRNLAVNAANAKDLGLLQTLLGGDPNPLRAALANDAPFQQLMLEKFPKSSNRRQKSPVLNPIASDILREGRISLASILKADTSTLLHFLDNPQNTDYVFTHATPKDQRNYILGRQITESNRQPANDAEAEAKRVYDVLEAAIQSQAEGPRQAILREQLLFGGKYLSSDLAGMVSDKVLIFFGGNYNVSDMLVHIENNLTEVEFNLLKNPYYRDEFARSLKSFLNPEEQEKIMALIVNFKLTAENFTDSKSKLRPLETFITDYKSSDSSSIKQFIERLESMSEDEANRYKTDPTFKKTIDDFAEFLIYRGDSQAENALPLIKSYLNQVAETGKPPVLTELDKLIKEWGYVQDDRWNGMSDAAIQAKKFQTIAQVELILKDPKHMATLRSIFNRQTNQEAGPVSREEAALTRTFNNMLWQCGAGTNAFYSLMVEGNTTVGMAGRRPFEGESVADKASTYSLIATLPKDQLDNWRYSLLFDYQKAILENVLVQNGTLTTADKMRVLVTQGGKLTDMSQDFANLSEAEFAQIEKEYLDKYKSDLKTDLRNSIPSRERMTPEQAALFETILSQNGKVFPIDRMRMLINGNGGKFQDYQGFFAELKPEDWTKLQTDYKQKYGVELKDAILAAVTTNERLDLNHQVLIRHILDEGNGTTQLVDRIRAFILGDGGKFSDFKQLLKDLTLEQRQKLHDDYLRVFGKNLDNDFLNKVDKAYKIEYALALSVVPRDGLNDFFLRMNQYAPMSVADGGDLALQRMLQVNEQILRQFNASMKDMPLPVQEAIAEYFSASFQNALDSNKKYAEFMTNVIMTTASVAAFIAFLPAGVSFMLTRAITHEMARKLVVMAALSTSGAVGRPALLAAYEGENFDSSPQALLMNGSLGALEMLLSYPFGMGVLATKSTVALTAAQATDRLSGVMGKIASLSGKADDPLLESTRAEAYKFITELGNFPDRKQMEVMRDQLLGALTAKGDTVTKDLVAMAATITVVTNEQATHQIPELITKINAIAPENTGALANTRSEAWSTLNAKSGISPEALAQARKDVLTALAAKQDPVATSALKALDSVDSLSNVSNNELADRLRDRIYQAILSTDAAAAEAIVQIQQQANQAITNLLIRKIDTQGLTLASADLQTLKSQALDALNSLSGLGNTSEIATLRNQLIEALAKAKDPAAQAALEVSSILEKQANNSLDLATLASFNQKMQQDSALFDAALNLLQKPKTDLDALTAKFIAEASTLPSNLAVPEITARAASATEQLSTLAAPANAEIVQALKKQATDAIDALAAQGTDKTQIELDFYQALIKHDSAAAATVANLQQAALHNATIKHVEDLLVSVQNASGNLTELATLRSNALEALVKLGDNPEALAMRARILSAFEQSQDPVTKVAVEAFASIKGLSNEETLSKEIMLALSRGSEQELQLIKLSAIKSRIATGTDAAETLRQKALTVISKLPAESQAAERLQLLRQLQDKDPISKSALQALESLEGLDGETRARFTLGILEALEQGNANAIKSVQISTLTQKIINQSGTDTNLLSQVLSLISTLGKDASSARIDFLKAIENKVVAAKSAREVLERSLGTENESEMTARILGALTTNNNEELARIQVSSIISSIERGGGDLNAAREQLLEAIFKLPNQEQQTQRLLGLKALKEKGDLVAKSALDLNDAFAKASQNALDLVSLAKLKQTLPQDIDSALAVFGRNRSHFNSLAESIAASSLDKIGTLDARAMTEHLSSLTEQITASAIDKEMVAALQKELTISLQTLATKIGDLSSGSFELAAIRERAMASLEALSSSAAQDEIKALKISILKALAAKDDPIAKFTLNVQSYFDNALTLNPEAVAAIEKLDPTLRKEALSLLGRTKEELDQIRLDSIARLGTVKPELSVNEAIDTITAAAEELRRLADASTPLRDSLRNQVTSSIDSIVNDIKNGSAALLGDKRKEAFILLDSLSQRGFSEAQEAALRTKILEALAAKDDPTAKAAIAAFDAVKGLEDEATRTTNILTALSRDSQAELRQIQVASIQDKILVAGASDLPTLRNQALEAISHLPGDIQQIEKIKFLTAIADKDPIAKTALNVKNYFDNAASLSYDDIIAIERLDPTLATETLAILGRTKSELDQMVNDSLTRLGTVKPNLTIEESLELIDKSVADLQRFAEVSGPVSDS
ncbi:hypothetical protein KA183_11325, partial [bacterium]|nr:hypothetical protein [bacterium]